MAREDHEDEGPPAREPIEEDDEATRAARSRDELDAASSSRATPRPPPPAARPAPRPPAPVSPSPRPVPRPASVPAAPARPAPPRPATSVPAARPPAAPAAPTPPARPSAAPAAPAAPPPPARPPAARPASSAPPSSPTSPTPSGASATSGAPRPPAPRPTPAASPAPSSPPGPPAAKGAASIELVPGQLFAGRYRIEKQLGKGGMGAVYLALQEPLARPVAIKVLHGTADDTTIARFQREARLIAQLQHPHIVGLIDFGEDDGRLYLAMEFIDGDSLTSILKREAPLPPKRVVELALQIAEALAVAHDINVVHRDIKPDNIMVLRTAGGQDFVKMLDFGVAKIKREGDAQNTVETKAGLIVGSLRYISPEQVESGDISPRTDLYSLGCVLYEMLAGRRVFEYPSPADCAIAHLTEAPRPPTVQQQPVRGPLVDFIMRCLEKKPAKRPANAREALKLLMACRDNPAEVAARPEEDPAESTQGGLPGGLDEAQGARTIEARPVVVPPAKDARAELAKPAPTSSAGPGGRMPDAELRPARPGGAASFDLVGPAQSDTQTSTNLDGIRLRARADAARSRWWLWALVGLLAAGGGAAAVLLLSGSGASPAPASPSPEADVVAVTPSAEDAAIATSEGPDTQAATADTQAATADTQAATDAAASELAGGTRIITSPEGAKVLRGGELVCTTPCLVTWPVEEKPPLVRLTLTGHHDIDLQLVKGDRGKEQRFELSPRP